MYAWLHAFAIRRDGTPSVRRRLMALAAVLLVVGCTSGERTAGAPAEAGDTRTVHVLRVGWHSGIIVPRAAALAGGIVEARGLPPGSWLEFGWGDRDYFTAPDPDLADALVAGMVPSDAVMHVVAYDALPAPGEQVAIVAVPLSDAGFERLVDEIAAAFDRPEGGVAESLAGTADLGGTFFPAHGRFYLFNTCNTWAARRLANAGVPLSPGGVVTADDLMQRLRAALGR